MSSVVDLSNRPCTQADLLFLVSISCFFYRSFIELTIFRCKVRFARIGGCNLAVLLEIVIFHLKLCFKIKMLVKVEPYEC